jgi:serine/threonine-protein kinase
MASAALDRVGTIGDYAVDRELPGVPGETCAETTHRVLPRRARLRVARDREAGIRLMREACILEALRLPGVPRVFEIGVADGLPWIADELVLGEPLAAPIAVEQIVLVVRDACTILAHLHRRGVIHDGIWPCSTGINAFIRTDDRGLCLTNWTRARLGEPAQGKADVHALGTAIYAALPGSAPLGVVELVDRMVMPDPALRPSAEEVAREATRLSEVAGGFDDPEIEEVILLTDLSRDPATLAMPPQLSKPKWTPAPAMAIRHTPGTPIALLKQRP